MMVAYHFNADGVEGVRATYGRFLRRVFFTAALGAQLHEEHVRISDGDLLLHRYLREEASREAILEALLGYHPDRWSTLGAEFRAVVTTHNIFVVVAQGLTLALRDHLDAELGKGQWYLGALEVDFADRLHLALYRALRPSFRMFGRELRIFYKGIDGDVSDAQDASLMEDLKRLPFSDVKWEDTGLKDTILDEYDKRERAARIARFQQQLSGRLSRMVDDLQLRLEDLGPDVNDSLEAAFRRSRSLESEEDTAQAATSCRRFLKTLADALYPARPEPVKGKKVDGPAYRNRLWAYLDARLEDTDKNLILAQLDDLGQRINRLDNLASKGVHDQIGPSELDRLIVGLVLIAYDLLALTPPPLQADLRPHTKAFYGFAKRVVGSGELEDEST